MKKFLPKTSDNLKGFTLIELLIVIAIIAILAAIGFAVYSNIGAQAKARNIKRRTDLDSISKALEVSKNSTGNYVLLANSQFSNGVIPDKDSQANLYCANSVADGQPADPSAAWTTTCPTDFGPVGTTNPPVGAKWKICTWLEAEVNPVKDPGVFCKVSTQ